MSTDGPVLFIALVDVPDEHAEDFLRWRETEMIPTQLATPGFISIRGYEAVTGPDNPYQGANLTSRFLNVYEIDSLESLQDAARNAGANQSDWSRRVHERMSSVALNVYRHSVPSVSNDST